MAISVDTVYQRVLTLANKEQRGYITPQEFNLLANQAQMSIFESYFFSRNLRDRQEPNRTGEVDESDIGELLNAKLNPFKSIEAVIVDGDSVASTFPNEVDDLDVFQTGQVFLGEEVCQKVSIAEAQRFRKSQRHIATTADQNPIYTDSTITGRDIAIYAGSATAVDTGAYVECFRVPATADWAYVVVNEKALYNATVAVDFELHSSEEDTLVYKVLELAGIVINKPGLVEIAAQKEAAEQQLQKI